MGRRIRAETGLWPPGPLARSCARAFAAAITLMAVEGAIAQTGSVLSLRRSSRTLPATGDPVWQLQLTLPGQKTHNFEAVVGRASRQQADRHRLGSQAPLPAGRYRLTEVSEIRPEDPVELGRVLWTGLEPREWHRWLHRPDPQQRPAHPRGAAGAERHSRSGGDPVRGARHWEA